MRAHPEDVAEQARTERDAWPEPDPVPMILHCPACHVQHIDAATETWANPPHRSHLCLACGCIWRPADIATEGVAEIETCGAADTWPPA